jgi:hypothetical protein
MMGGNLINYSDDCGTPTADILTTKLMANSIISTPNSKFMTINIKDLYLMMPMDRYKYFRMKLELFPQDIIDEYGLCNTKWTPMAMSSVKCNTGCTASYRPASLLKNSSPNAFTKQDTSIARSHQDTGVMTGAPPASPLSSTILA